MRPDGEVGSHARPGSSRSHDCFQRREGRVRVVEGRFGIARHVGRTEHARHALQLVAAAPNRERGVVAPAGDDLLGLADEHCDEVRSVDGAFSTPELDMMNSCQTRMPSPSHRS